MIVKRIKQNKRFAKDTSRHITDLASYILDARSQMRGEAQQEKVLCSGSMGFAFSSRDAQIAEMCALAARCPRSEQPTNHYVLSWRPEERPTPEQIKEAVEIFVSETGLVGHQVLWGAHANTDCIHAHVQINRVNPQTEKICKINNGFDRIICQQATAKIEAAQGWEPAQNSLYIVDATGELRERTRADNISISDGARQAEQRTCSMSAERRAKLLIPALQEAKSWQDFHKILRANNAFYNLKAGGAVFRFGDDKSAVKASRISRDFSKTNMEKKFGQYEQPSTTEKEQKMETMETQHTQEHQPQTQPAPEQTEPQHGKTALVAFVDKSAAEGLDALKDDSIVSALHSHYSSCTDKETMFTKINEDITKSGITLSTEETKTISDTIFNAINASKIEEQKETEPKQQEEKPEESQEKGTLVDLSKIDNPLELLLLLILAVLGIGIACQAAEQADEAAQAAAEAAALVAQKELETEVPAPTPTQAQTQPESAAEEQSAPASALEPKPESKPEPQPKPEPKPQPARADWAPCGMLYRDVYKFAAEHIASGYAHRNFDPPSGAKLDTAIATRLAVCGYNQAQIASALAAGSPSASDPDYITKKAAEPFAANQAQVSKYIDKSASWRKEEKKDVVNIQREYKKAGIAIPAELRQKMDQGMKM